MDQFQLPHREPTLAERDELFGAACGLAEGLGRHLAGRSSSAQQDFMPPGRSRPLAYLEALSELAAAVECAADNAVSDARRDGASHRDLAQAWGVSDAEALQKWGPSSASGLPTADEPVRAELVPASAATTVAGLQSALECSRAECARLQEKLRNHIVMEQATGILAERWHVSVREAVAAFGPYSCDDRRRLARQIVDGAAWEGNTAQHLPEG